MPQALPPHGRRAGFQAFCWALQMPRFWRLRGVGWLARAFQPWCGGGTRYPRYQPWQAAAWPLPRRAAGMDAGLRRGGHKAGCGGWFCCLPLHDVAVGWGRQAVQRVQRAPGHDGPAGRLKARPAARRRAAVARLKRHAPQHALPHRVCFAALAESGLASGQRTGAAALGAGLAKAGLSGLAAAGGAFWPGG